MDPQRRPAWSPFFNAECAVAAHSRPTLAIMNHRRLRPIGPIPTMTPEWVLGERWQKISTLKTLAQYLRRVIVAERRCIAGTFPRYLLPRFRWRRLSVAHRLVALGGTVHPRVFTQPNARGWSAGEPMFLNIPMRLCRPGMFQLVPIVKDIQ